MSRPFLLAFLCVSLAACGGSGGGGSAEGPVFDLPPPQSPTVAITENNALPAAAISMMLPGVALQLTGLAAVTALTVLSRSEKQLQKSVITAEARTTTLSMQILTEYPGQEIQLGSHFGPASSMNFKIQHRARSHSISLYRHSNGRQKTNFSREPLMQHN